MIRQHPISIRARRRERTEGERTARRTGTPARRRIASSVLPLALTLVSVLAGPAPPAAADAPLVTLENPPDGLVTARGDLVARVRFQAQPADGNVSLVELFLNDQLVGSFINARKVKDRTLDFLVDLAALADGPALVTAMAYEGNPNEGIVGQDDALVVIDRSAPQVVITEPADGSLVSAGSVTVSGTVSEPAAVTVNGVEAVVSGSAFSATVALGEGSNVVAAGATDTAGNVTSAAVVVVRDTTPPLLTLLSPAAGSRVQGAAATVAGLVTDPEAGPVAFGDVTVTVNGVAATVAGGSFLATGVPVAAGRGTVTAVALDRAGLSTTAVVAVTGDSAPKARVVTHSGDAQQGTVGGLLAQPLTVLLEDSSGDPVEAAAVTFTVTRGDGTLTGGARELVVLSDAFGLASVDLRLGSRAGAASDRVSATAPGFFGEAVFHAGAAADGQRALSASDGARQVGPASALAPEPLVARLGDGRGNPVAGESVTFEVFLGGGRVENAPSTTVVTDADGRAFALFGLGPDPGVQAVEARTGGGETARFLVTAVAAGDPASTALDGLVLSPLSEPVAGATVDLVDSGQSTVTDVAGRFRLTGTPTGRVHLAVDAIGFASRRVTADLVPGVANPLPRPVYLALADGAGQGTADPDLPAVIGRGDTPGFGLTLPAGSAAFPGGGTSGGVEVARVYRDKVPAGDGLPRLALAVEPPDVAFDPPAPLRLPNVDGRAPGEVVTLFAFDEERGRRVPSATARVSDDGATVVSEPGQGLVRGGFFFTAPEAGERTCVTGSCLRIRCASAGLCQKCSPRFLAGGTCATATVAEACLDLDPADPNDQTIFDLAAAGTPDVDCYQVCSDSSPCTAGTCGEAEVLAGEPPCVRRFDPVYGLGGLPGTCRIPVDTTRPVCCPDEHWDATNGRCCSEPVNSKGLCEAQGVVP